MIHAWYEKSRDVKDHIYFALHEGKRWGGGGPNFLPGFHNAIEMAFGIKGSMDITIDGKKYVLNEGEICFMNSREPHRYYYNPSVSCYVVLITRDFFNEVNQWGSISFPTHMEKSEHFAALKAYLDYMMARWDEDSLLCKRAFADTLAYLMMRSYPYFPKTEMGKQSAAILDAVAYICEHYTERLTVGGVAKRFGYSSNYFSTAFNEFMGTSFPDYLNTCRMIEYQRLRREQPKLPAVRAAEMCGFCSMNTFYRAQQKFEKDRSLVFDPLRKTVP